MPREEFRTSLSEYDAMVYHTVLTDLEGMLLNVSGKNNLAVVLSDYQKVVADSVSNPDLKAFIGKNLNKFKKAVETYKGEYDNYTMADWMIRGIRRERKKYDRIYFYSLLKRGNPDLGQAREFMETIRESDPAYYNAAYAVLLECFKDFSSNVFRESIVSREERIETVERARGVINSLNDDFEILVVDEREKPYEYRIMDRVLFDGMLSYKAKEETLPAYKCLNNLERRYCARKSDVSKNARVVIDVFKYVMKKYNLEEVPFSVLNNKVCEELEKDVAIDGSREFFVVLHGEDGKAKKKQNNKLAWIEPLQFYCADHGIPYPKEGMDRGLKYTYRKSIESNPDNKQAFCEAMEAYLVDFCDRNSDYFDSRVITAAFARKKFYPQSEDDLYSFLTKDSVTDADGKKLGQMFLKELHHDRERIGFSNNPNDSTENFILTFAVSSKVGEKKIYDYCVRLLRDKGWLAKEQADDLLQQASSFEGAQFNIHDQILHGADVKMHYFDGQQKHKVMYYLTPVRPKEHNARSRDRYVLAMVDTSGFVYDSTKYRYRTRSYEQIMDDVAQLKNMGRA